MTRTGPTVSVVLPTYNRAHTLGRALASVRAQSRAPDEVIVVDDGSTDRPDTVVAGFPGARLLRLGANGGAARARNVGAREARGDWIAFIDSDDAWKPGKLAAQLAHAAGAPGLVLLGTGVCVHEGRGRATAASFPAGAPPSGWSYEDLHRYPFGPSTWLVDRRALLDVGAFDEALPNCEDLDLLARLVAAGARIEMVADLLVDKYLQPDGLDADLRRRGRSYGVLCERHRALWSREPVVAGATLRRLAEIQLATGDAPGARASFAAAARLQPAALRLRILGALARLGARPPLAALRIYRSLLKATGRAPR